ncbi:MAG: sporulation integral membrane protein YlbJ [Firmicutes bacterium]|nr:sporulation integral membrane protein YlbJ [Bacillota bacterium]
MTKVNNRATIFWAIASILVVILLVKYPEQAFQAALEGLRVWWEVVFPALLPFFIVAEILMGVGVVNFVGVLLEPLMRPVFNIPGEGAFPLAMGLASGYPLGARITRGLYDKEDLTRTEAERLICFCNTANPLFMIGAVSVGMFGTARIGTTLIFVHYVSARILGFLLSFLEKRPKKTRQKSGRNTNIFVKAWQKMLEAKQRDGRTFGDILGDAVWVSVNSVLRVGGFIVFFAVLIRLFDLVGLSHLLATVLNLALVPLFGEGLARPLIGGFFEVTTGCQLAAASSATFVWKIAITNAIIAWSGLSVFGQVKSMIKGTDIRQGLFIKSRVIHAVLAFLITPLSLILFPLTMPVWTGATTSVGNIALFVIVLVFGLILSLIIDTIQKAKITWLRW